MMNTARLPIFVLIANLVGWAPLGCTAADTQVLAEPATFKVADEAAFADYREPLLTYLRGRHVSNGANVCILGERAADGSQSAWVIWPHGQTILLWDGGSSKMSASRRILDLKKDVVASEDEVAGSTYLVTRDWVNQLKARCTKLGTTVQISAAELRAKTRKP